MDLSNILLTVSGIANLLLGFLFLYHRNKNLLVDIAFSLLTFTISIWAFLDAGFRYISDPSMLNIVFRIFYAIPAFIPAFFLYFIILFLNIGRGVRERFFRLLIFIPPFIFFLLSLFTNSIVVRAVAQKIGENIVFFGKEYPFFIAYNVIFFAAGYYFLIKRHFEETAEEKQKKQIEIIFFGTFIPGSLAVLTNLLLPYAGIFAFNWMGPIFTFFFVISIVYAIQKYQLLDMKVIGAEILVFFIWIFLLLRFLFEEAPQERVFDQTILVFSIAFGIFLIRSVKKEVMQRERLENISTEISSVNAKLQALDRQKTEFISLASHQLRTPITAVKGYASMLLEGSFGKLEGKSEIAVREIFDESQKLAHSVENLLVVSRIEQGRIQYTFTNFDFEELVADVVNTSQPDAKQKNLDMTLEAYGAVRYGVHGDREKLKQLVQNLIENAIEYTEEGFVRVLLVHDDVKNLLRLSVSDTGRGMNEKEQKEAFGEGENIEEQENRPYSLKKGMGLYISKQFVKAHNGKIWGESPGRGKGSTFFVELPYVTLKKKVPNTIPVKKS